jgi:hypothetical protein
MGTPDLTLQECCDRWGVSSRNSVKSRAAALGVELRRESSTRTVWPRDDVPLGDELHEHLQQGGTLRDFPGALPKPSTLATSKPSALTAAGGSSDAILVAMLQMVQQQAQAAPPAPLARARALAAAADERLPLTTPELAELMGLDADEVGKLRSGTVVYGFRLVRVGRLPRVEKPKNGEQPKPPAPDRRAWLLSRIAEGDHEDAVTAITVVPPVTPDQRRGPGFMACLDVDAQPMGRIELPNW